MRDTPNRAATAPLFRTEMALRGCVQRLNRAGARGKGQPETGTRSQLRLR